MLLCNDAVWTRWSYWRNHKDLFILSEQRKDVISYEILVQMLEIYNEQVRDLLATDGSNKRYIYPSLIYTKLSYY
jgi:hypothetical protein